MLIGSAAVNGTGNSVDLHVEFTLPGQFLTEINNGTLQPENLSSRLSSNFWTGQPEPVTKRAL